MDCIGGGGEEWKQGDQCEEAITVTQVRNDVGVDQGGCIGRELDSG